MASTYSTSLKLTLIGDGDQSGIWGQTTNTNLGTLLEQAITGVTSIVMADANYTLTSFNGVTDEARNAVLVVTGTNNAQRDLIPPVVKKLYTVVNNTTGGYAIRVIGSSGTGVIIPNGATCLVYCDGTNFVNGLSGTTGNFSINGALSTTGALTYGGVTLSNSVTGTGSMALSASPALTGTPTAPTAANGTNTTQIATTAFVNASVTNATNSLGTMSTQNANAVTITGGAITGITDLDVADGGTGRSSLTANNVVLGNGASAVNFVAPGASGNVLSSNGTTWTSAAVSTVGVGQTWQSVSRTAGVTYTNTTGKPICFLMSFGTGSGSSETIILTISGTSMVFISGVQVSGVVFGQNMAIIPVGATYSYTQTAGVSKNIYELR